MNIGSRGLAAGRILWKKQQVGVLVSGLISGQATKIFQ